MWRAPLRAGLRSVRLVGSTVYGMLDVGHSIANVVVRLSLVLFCFGLVLQALSSKFRAGVGGWLVRHWRSEEISQDITKIRPVLTTFRRYRPVSVRRAHTTWFLAAVYAAKG